MGEVVSTSLNDGIAVVRVDKPPVNTMDQSVRAGLWQEFSEARTNPDVKAIVLACAGRTFIAGADIKEFDTGVREPAYHDVFRLIEGSPVPVIAAIHGTALGAGTEVALTCHYRVAAEGASLGLPELSLGIIPGAGGTQRMPRLIPFEAAADMMLSGRPLNATQAKELGLVDRVVKGEVTEGAIAYAKELVAAGDGPRKTRERPVVGAEKVAETLKAKRAQVAKTMRNRESPIKLLEALQAAVEKPFDEGLKVEKAVSASLEQATEFARVATFVLRRARGAQNSRPFFQRDAAADRPYRHHWGRHHGRRHRYGIRQRRLPVTMIDASQEALDRGRATIRKNYERSVSRGSLTADNMDARMKLIALALDYDRGFNRRSHHRGGVREYGLEKEDLCQT